jgi:hypothetical protein
LAEWLYPGTAFLQLSDIDTGFAFPDVSIFPIRFVQATKAQAKAPHNLPAGLVCLRISFFLFPVPW